MMFVQLDTVLTRRKSSTDFQSVTTGKDTTGKDTTGKDTTGKDTAGKEEVKVRPALCYLFAGQITVLALLVAPAQAQTGGGEELINRREEARREFLATPAGIYQHYCAHCHGDDGAGDGRQWMAESPKPADLTASELDPPTLVKFITEGSAASGRESNFCPPWGRSISSPNLQRLARYLVSLRGQAQPEPPPQPESETSQPQRLPAGASFPWVLLGVILAEGVVLTCMVLVGMVRR